MPARIVRPILLLVLGLTLAAAAWQLCGSTAASTFDPPPTPPPPPRFAALPRGDARSARHRARLHRDRPGLGYWRGRAATDLEALAACIGALDDGGRAPAPATQVALAGSAPRSRRRAGSTGAWPTCRHRPERPRARPALRRRHQRQRRARARAGRRRGGARQHGPRIARPTVRPGQQATVALAAAGVGAARRPGSGALPRPAAEAATRRRSTSSTAPRDGRGRSGAAAPRRARGIARRPAGRGRRLRRARPRAAAARAGRPGRADARRPRLARHDCVDLRRGQPTCCGPASRPATRRRPRPDGDDPAVERHAGGDRVHPRRSALGERHDRGARVPWSCRS